MKHAKEKFDLSWTICRWTAKLHKHPVYSLLKIAVVLLAVFILWKSIF